MSTCYSIFPPSDTEPLLGLALTLPPERGDVGDLLLLSFIFLPLGDFERGESALPSSSLGVDAAEIDVLLDLPRGVDTSTVDAAS